MEVFSSLASFFDLSALTQSLAQATRGHVSNSSLLRTFTPKNEFGLMFPILSLRVRKYLTVIP